MTPAPNDEPRLTLEAVSEEGTLLRERRKAFGPDGGTIGRSPTADWVLSDEYVSRQHARVFFEGGQFFIEDTNSKGGVSLNGRKLGSGRAFPIASGDRLRIEPYDIAVRVAASSPVTNSTKSFTPPAPMRMPPTVEVPPDDPLKTHYPAPRVTQPPPRPTQPPPPPKPSHDLDLWMDVEPLLENLIDESVRLPVPPENAAPPDESADVERSRVVESPKAPTDRLRRTPMVEQLSALAQAAHALGAESMKPSSPSAVDQLFASAGVDPARVPPEVAEQLGGIVREVVSGLLDILAARQKARDAFRIQGTMFRPRGNNPLKFSTDVDDALHNLFVKRGVGYLGPVEAFEDAFNDLRHHQLAVVAAMKKAFQTVLEKFDPVHLQRRFDQTSKGGKRMGLLQGTPNYWAMYGEWVDSLMKDPDGSFRDLFGEVFSQAYEEQLKRLRAELRPTEARKPK